MDLAAYALTNAKAITRPLLENCLYGAFSTALTVQKGRFLVPVCQ
ncbi:hypothetical protein B932_2732 [Gluconobacter oxydans H24]|nr:hypothetical protein B932_2732 [Gluconobacter oxydans H24]